MVSTYTNNFELEKQGVGDNVDTWGDPTLNTNVIQRIDDALGKTTEVALTSSNVTLTQTQWRTKALKLTGTISANITISLPLSINSVADATAVGGEFIVDNRTSGAFTITVKTAAATSTGVEVPQGYRSILYSDAVNVTYADDQDRSTVLTYAGNPNGFVAGTAGSFTTPASVIYDRTNGIYYICTTSGIAAVAVWSALTGPVPTPGGYLTTSSSTDNVVQTGDAIGATVLYYAPYTGTFVPIFNGTTFVPVPFTQQPLTLSASQASNSIYDVYEFMDGATLRIGFGPAWTAGSGGSVTAGSCARGTGAGGAAIQRINGIWVNTASMTVNNGANTYSVAAQRGTCIASVFINSTQGQVTCHRTWGQSRKWGVWNFYNRLPVYLKAGDSTSSWTIPNIVTPRPSNNNTANSLTLFSGLAEEAAELTNRQVYSLQGVPVNMNPISVGIGINVTNAFSSEGRAYFMNGNTSNTGQGGVLSSQYVMSPSLGINTISSLESITAGGVNLVYGGESLMQLAAQWRA